MADVDTAQDVDWTTVAAGWSANREHVETMKRDVSRRMLDGLGLRPGDRVLELGAGTGEFARRLASVVGETGHVRATDVAAGMLALVRGTTAGLDNVDTAAVDAADIPEPDEAFDAVVFRMGLMCLPEPERALGECARVLRPGGRLAVTTWAAPEYNPWLTAVGMSCAVHALLSGPPPVAAGGVFSLHDPTRLTELALAAGFVDASVEAIDVSVDFADVDTYLSHVTSMAPPLAAAFAHATDDQRVAVRATVEQLTEQHRTAHGLVIPGRALLLLAVR